MNKLEVSEQLKAFINNYDGSHAMKADRIERYLIDILYVNLSSSTMRNQSNEEIGQFVKEYLDYMDKIISEIE